MKKKKRQFTVHYIPDLGLHLILLNRLLLFILPEHTY